MKRFMCLFEIQRHAYYIVYAQAESYEDFINNVAKQVYEKAALDCELSDMQVQEVIGDKFYIEENIIEAWNEEIDLRKEEEIKKRKEEEELRVYKRLKAKYEI